MRWLVLGWVGATLVATAVLGVAGTKAGPLPEWGHEVGHLVLCGGLAAMICVATPGGAVRRATGALVGVGLFGAAIELIQLSHRPGVGDVSFDLGMDLVGGAVGVALWSMFAGRTVDVGHLLSVVFHPLVVAPLGLAAVVVGSGQTMAEAVRWTAVGAVCVAPAIGWWALGLGRRWWTDPDVSRRTDRRTMFLLGCVGMAVFQILALSGPPAVSDLAVGILVGTVIGTAMTVSGLKVSGHVAIPAMLGLSAGSLPLIGVAVVLSWARVAAGRHRPVEVGVAWILAALAMSVVG